jgi:hypothetical protein
MLLKIKHIFLAVIYFKIIYCFFASSPWYKAFHIKSRNVAIKAFGWELNHKTGSERRGKKNTGGGEGECGALQRNKQKSYLYTEGKNRFAVI